MREEGVRLEDDADVAVVSRPVIDQLVVEPYVARDGRYETGDDVEQRRLAGAAWPEQSHELAGVTGQGDAVQDRRAA